MSERKQRIPELDGLRVLMIFIVSWYHIWQQSWLRPVIGNTSLDFLVRGGSIWVDGTVLLSAFLLYRPYARAARRGDPLPDPGGSGDEGMPNTQFLRRLCLLSGQTAAGKQSGDDVRRRLGL